MKLLLVLAQLLGGPEPNTEEGARRFVEGDLDGALRAFSQALGEHPDAPENNLNIAGVHYRKGGDALPQAVLGYRSALGTAEGMTRRDAFFNLGNALLRGGSFEDAAGAYAEAILLDPEDLEARQNLELALRQQQEQEQQQQDQQPDEGDRDDEEQQDREQQPDEGQGDQEEQDQQEQPQPQEQGEVPEFSPQQAERILAALAEMERQFQEEQREANRARAVRRGRH